MLRKANDLFEYAPHAEDGIIGKIEDFYFDDETWTVRYLVLRAGSWLTGRMVLISPVSILGVDPVRKIISLRLTRNQVENAPPVDTHQPVSRRYEAEYFSYYKWPRYWGHVGRWGSWPAPSILAIPGIEWTEPPEKKPEETHLHSVNEVKSYSFHALDGNIGGVEDFIIDDVSWAVRYLEVDTVNWLPGKYVLLSPHWIREIHWNDKKVRIDLEKSAIEHAPPYNPRLPISKEYEDMLFRYYRREKDREAVYLKQKAAK